MLSRNRKSVFEPPAKFISKKLITLEVKLVDRLVPDRLLCFYLNTLDKRVPPKAIDGVINGLDRLPQKVRSSLITAADEYVPDAVASSRKVSAVISGVWVKEVRIQKTTVAVRKVKICILKFQVLRKLLIGFENMGDSGKGQFPVFQVRGIHFGLAFHS